MTRQEFGLMCLKRNLIYLKHFADRMAQSHLVFNIAIDLHGNPYIFKLAV